MAFPLLSVPMGHLNSFGKTHRWLENHDEYFDVHRDSMFQINYPRPSVIVSDCQY